MIIANYPAANVTKVIRILVFSIGFMVQAVDASEIEAIIESEFKSGNLPGLHSVLVYHNGKVVAESYFEGRDYNYGRSLGKRNFNATSLHDIRSITKNITGLLYGIALSEGLVASPDSILVDQFPYQDLKNDPARRKIKIEHALAMTMGTEWDESVPYTSTANSEIAMEYAPDRYRYVLDRPLVSEPGTEWVYSGGATTVIGEIVARGAGMPVDQFAREKLFSPMGITNFEWSRGSDGSASTASGLRMTNHDLAKIGLMLINNGQYEGKQIVPQNWIIESSRQRSVRSRPWQYGYLWWLSPETVKPSSVDGFGNGGQRLYVSRQGKAVIVIFAGNYNKKGAWKMPDRVVNEIVIPIIYDRD